MVCTQKIGEDASAEVFEAAVVHANVKAGVAMIVSVKMYKPQTALKDLWKNESNILQELERHPHVTAYLGYGLAGKRPFIVLEHGKLHLGKGKSSVRTKTIKNEHSPLWRHTDKIEDFYHGDKLAISVRDADRMKHDDMLGQVQLQTEQLIPDGFEGDLKLRNTGWKDPENHPVFVTMVIKVISRQKVDS